MSTVVFAERGIDVTSKLNRIALIIGNANYESSPLKNPVNDANDMAFVLKQKGFAVTLLKDASQRQMEKAIKNFGVSLRNGGVGLFFYAGHGMQVNGINYLIPIGSNIELEEDIKYDSVNANRVLTLMESADNEFNMVFLDACRNNPFSRSFRSGSRGLAQMDAPTGSLIAYATAPGSIAADGNGRNGLFTGQLIKHMQVPDLELTKMMKEVRKQVLKESENKQTPWDVSSLTGDFYFTGGNDQGTTIIEVDEPKKQLVQKTPTAASEMESEMWAMVKDSRSTTDLEIFIESYPNSAYRKHAESKLWLLSGQSIESIKTYLFKYPNSPFKRAAGKRVWDLINAKDSLVQYERFINEFPDNRFIGFAKLKVSKLKQAEQERLEKERIEKIRLAKKRLANIAVFDDATGLIWQKGESGKMNWKQAINYCQNLSLSGYNDWKLPEKEELLSTRIIQTKFSKRHLGGWDYYWTSETYQRDDERAWWILYKSDYKKVTDVQEKIFTSYVRCVRQME
jgi:hypothetical protein